MKKPIAIDLFCGAGGMSEGILQAGFNIVFSSDKSEEAGKTYQARHEQLGLKQNYNTYFENMDIKDLTGKYIREKVNNLDVYKESKEKIIEIDAIFGGPPCQGFSRAGLRKENDPRNFLFREYLRVVNDLKPKYVVMENVLGLLDTKLKDFVSYSGKIYDGETKVTRILESEFRAAGYHIKDYGLHKDETIDFKKLILNSSDFGAPQRRQRVIIVAYRDGEKEPQDINNFKCKEKVSIKEALADLITDKKKRKKALEELKAEGKMSYLNDSKNGRTHSTLTNKPLSLLEAFETDQPLNSELSKHLHYIEDRFSLFKEGESAKNVKDRFLKKSSISYKKIPALLQHSYNLLNKKGLFLSIEEYEKALDIFDKLGEELKEEIINAIFSKKNIRVKLNSHEPSRTVVTLPDDYISPFEKRTFSVREMARLQSFDDSFEFLGKRTTGGARRKFEVPQYTQVGNAVPPLLARAVAKTIMDVLVSE